MKAENITDQVDQFEGRLRHRIELTVSGSDSEAIPKIDEAGTVVDFQGERVQLMHNGVKVLEGAYYGAWTTEVIKRLKGHHEPQEELAFDWIIRRLQKEEVENPRMIELGSFWAYYSLWFLSQFPGGKALGIEPDPRNLEIGRRNAKINGLDDRMLFLAGAIGPHPGTPLNIGAESGGKEHFVDQINLEASLGELASDRADILLADIQGAETHLLESERDLFLSRKVRFLVVSTHHHSISDDYLTHQKVLRLVQEHGGHVIAEHSVYESFSGDGLIVASFDERDQDCSLLLSRSRSQDAIFRELEFDLDQQREELDRKISELDAAVSRIKEMENTKIWRCSLGVRNTFYRFKHLKRRNH